MSAYLSIQYHNEIAVTINNSTGKRAIVTMIRSGPEATLNTTYIDDDEDVTNGKPVEFFIDVKADGYRFGYRTNQQAEVKYVASVANKWLQAYVEG